MTEDEIDDEIDRIYSHVDDLLRAGKFHEVDTILVSVDVTILPIVVSLAYATITCPASHVLLMRQHYMKKLRQYYQQIEPSRVDALLAGLD